MNLLFVCTYNKMRSRTAETIYSSDPMIKSRSAGTSRDANTRINPDLLRWADKIFVMEDWHKTFILEGYPDETLSMKIIVLNIPDMYYYMEPELVKILKARIRPYL